MRLTDDDKKLGPITYGKSEWSVFRVVLSSGDRQEEDEHQNTLCIHAFGWVAEIKLPQMLSPYVIVHPANWDAATIARIGRDWFEETHSREFGFVLGRTSLRFLFGAQTFDGHTTKSFYCTFPWTEWRFHRHTFYDDHGGVHWTKLQSEMQPFISHGFAEQQKAEEECPHVQFEIEDYDGRKIIASTIMEQREWKLGVGWCKWLSWFRKNKVVRSLKIDFSEQVGKDKGSWKGGMTGHGIDMLSNESHVEAMRRYCDKVQNSKSGDYKIKYLGILQGK